MSVDFNEVVCAAPEDLKKFNQWVNVLDGAKPSSRNIYSMDDVANYYSDGAMTSIAALVSKYLKTHDGSFGVSMDSPMNDDMSFTRIEGHNGRVLDARLVCNLRDEGFVPQSIESKGLVDALRDFTKLSIPEVDAMNGDLVPFIEKSLERDENAFSEIYDEWRDYDSGMYKPAPQSDFSDVIRDAVVDVPDDFKHQPTAEEQNKRLYISNIKPDWVRDTKIGDKCVGFPCSLGEKGFANLYVDSNALREDKFHGGREMIVLKAGKHYTFDASVTEETRDSLSKYKLSDGSSYKKIGDTKTPGVERMRFTMTGSEVKGFSSGYPYAIPKKSLVEQQQQTKVDEVRESVNVSAVDFSLEDDKSAELQNLSEEYPA